MPMYREFVPEVEARCVTEDNIDDIASAYEGKVVLIKEETEINPAVIFDHSVARLGDYVIVYEDGVGIMSDDEFNETFEEVLA